VLLVQRKLEFKITADVPPRSHLGLSCFVMPCSGTGRQSSWRHNPFSSLRALCHSVTVTEKKKKKKKRRKKVPGLPKLLTRLTPLASHPILSRLGSPRFSFLPILHPGWTTPNLSTHAVISKAPIKYTSPHSSLCGPITG
jgi:hypothetical protein